MAEKADCSDVGENFASPVLPKGRGIRSPWQRIYSGAVGHGLDSGAVGYSQSLADSGRGTGLSRDPCYTPVGQSMAEGPLTSTPGGIDAAAISHLTDIVGQLGAQIGESIVAKLISVGVVNASSVHQSNASLNTSPTQTSADSSAVRHPDSHVTVHVKSDTEPKFFRGDGSDKYPVQDWIGMTKAYLRKQRCPVDEQAEEIMGKLMGKARDVVKVALRSDQTLDVKLNPDLIYDVLLQYFSDTSSCLPLADFYSTLPRPGESPVDYWLRVNRAAELADEGLCRQGRRMENQNEEVARMFVKYCPDPELSSVFKCKPIQEWSARDIQLRIDDYQRELRTSGRACRDMQVKSHTTTIVDMPSNPVSCSQPMSDQCYAQCPAFSPTAALNSVCHTQCSPSVTVASQSHAMRQTPCQPSCPPVSAVLQDSQEDRIVSRMMAMLEQMMGKVQQRNSAPRGGRFQGGHREKACRVCNDSKHTTATHCRSERLCFVCLAPGHTKMDCPAKSSSEPQSMGN